jgi:DNA-binding NarL/FixJ family response regulator
LTYRILIADDHAVVRDGLKRILLQEGFEISTEASDGREAVDMACQCYPDVALLDIAMPLLNGIDAAREIRVQCTGTRTILLTMHKETNYIIEAFRAGVKGYVLKTQASSDLVSAIHSTIGGDVYLSPGISDRVVEAALKNDSFILDPLTQREREILQLIAEGKTNKETSLKLGMSVKTVESDRHNLMTKLSLHETAGLVRYAIKIGLVQP